MFDTKLSESRAPMKLSVTVIAKVLACLILFIWLTQTAEAAPRVLLGVYYGHEGWDITQVQAMESWQGKKHAVVNLFTNWCDETGVMDNLFTRQLPNLWDNQNIPMITWKPTLGNADVCTSTSTPLDVEVQAANGTYDAYFHLWAQHLKNFLKGPDGVYNNADDRRVYLRLAHEMNGDWYEWSAYQGNNSPADYINMWHHVKAILDSKNLNATHVQWVWAVNNTDFGGFPAEDYYPGDSYVNWVAIDGYNFGASSWKTPHEVFDPMASRLRALTTKPLAITEVGSTTDGGINVVAKAQWITTFFNEAVNNNVKMVVWFNEDKTNDWAVFGGANGDGSFYDLPTLTYYNTYGTYQTAVASNRFVSSNGTNPRLLTNAQFAGQ